MIITKFPSGTSSRWVSVPAYWLVGDEQGGLISAVGGDATVLCLGHISCCCRTVAIQFWGLPKQKILTILIYNSHPILMQFSCNNRWDFQKCPCNSHLQFSSNSHQTILIQFSPTILIQFSLTILIQFSPDNSHPIFTWQFSSNFHLTILIQFSPTILTQFSSTLLSQFSPTMLSQFSRNDQPICSHQSCCYFYSMLIL